MSSTLSGSGVPGKPSQFKVLVAALTRERPIMLGQLLESWTACEIPGHCEVEFAIIENDDGPHSKAVVDRYADRLPGKLVYVVETRKGIPIARNAAVTLALENGFDALVFIDDDETADRRWIAELVARQQETGALLVGGPVAAIAGSVRLTPWRRLLFAGIEHRYRVKAEKNADGFKRGQGRLPTIITNNWLANSALFSRHNLRFDETLVFSGGSDASFDHAVTALGLQKAWAENAKVFEQISMDRISFRYQFRRGRDQSIASAARKRGSGRVPAYLAIPATLTFRAIGVAAAAVSIPVLGGPALLSFARSSGWLWGRFLAAVGGQSRLYEKTTGD